MKFNERELDIIGTALFHFYLYCEQNPDCEYVEESNGLLPEDCESDFNYSMKEIEVLHEKVNWS